MKNPILRYGVYSSVALLVLFLLSYFAIPSDYDLSEKVGYAAIVASMIFVFLGIRQYREEVGNGKISFWKAVKVGLLIVAIPSVVFGFYNLFHVFYLEPDSVENYFQHQIDQAKLNSTPEEFAEKSAELESDKELFKSPVIQFLAMSAAVFLIGIVASFVSSFVLKTEQNV